MRLATLLCLSLIPGVILSDEPSPYAGEELRPIKSLSADEIDSLRKGAGMGFAKPAELNHYPGPRHVLELADELELTPSQVAATEKLFDEMQRNAVALGEQLLQAERRLDRDFANETIDPERLEHALLEIGRIRAGLRYVHLEAHLRQKELLTPLQVSKYDEVRGYRGGGHGHDTEGGAVHETQNPGA